MYGCTLINEFENDVPNPSLQEPECDFGSEESKNDENNIDEICSSIIPITEIINNNDDDLSYHLPAHHR